MMDGWMDGWMKLSDKGCQPVPTGHSDIRRILSACVCVLQDGTQSDNIGLRDLYLSKAYNMRAASLQPL